MPPPKPAPLRADPVALTHLGFGAHRDDFTICDHLNRRALVRGIAEQIAVDRAPMVLGLHGDWGSGKTSTLRAIQYHLSGENPHGEKLPVDDIAEGLYRGHVVSVWFGAWRYQHEAAPVVALLQEMRRQLALWQRANARLVKLSTVAAESLLDSLDKAAKLIGLESLPLSAKDVRSQGERWERERLEQALPTDTIQEFLRQAITGLLPPQRKGFPGPRVVVFIDDLDRCAAEAAYRLLEGLKIYLQLDNCVFVLGMNQQVVIEAISERLKKDERDSAVLLRAEAYLEKLCSNLWRLPLPADPVVYFCSLIDDASARASVFAAQTGDTTKGLTPCPSFLPPNPRRLRALANMFNRLVHLAPSLADTFTTDLHLRLLVVAYLYQFHSELYQRWHYDANFLLRIRSWLASSTPVDPATEPYFARLVLPTQLRVGGTSSAVPVAASVESRFPDPSAPGTFWIAPLLQITLSKAAPTEFQGLLRLAA